MYIGRAPQDNIRIGRAVGIAQRAGEIYLHYLCHLLFSTPVLLFTYPCAPEPLSVTVYQSNTIVDSKLDSRCQNCSSRDPLSRVGGGAGI